MNKQLNVGIADMKMTRYEGTLITYALGSCVGIALYDSYIKLGALIHIMLPTAENMDQTNLFKYGDLGIAETIRKMNAFGASNAHISAKIAGGAKMFEMHGNTGFGNIGLRNVESVKSTLRYQKIRLVSEDTGANYARTMSFDVESGQVFIRTYGRQELVL